jgi:RimJ/RimL family protein N-acetyltransferase
VIVEPARESLPKVRLSTDVEEGNIRIREFAAEDYPALATIHNAIYPTTPTTEDECRERDLRRSPSSKHGRWVAVHDGRVVGVAQHLQVSGDGEPLILAVGVNVLPRFDQQEVLAALYGCVSEAAEPLLPIALEAYGCDNRPGYLEFLAGRGFQEYLRECDFELEVVSFDPTPFAGLEDELRSRGIELEAVSALTGDPERDRKLHLLYWDLFRDVPGEEDAKPTEFETWQRDYLNSPHALPEGYFVARRGDVYVGQTNLWKTEDAEVLYQKLTGVLPAYRRRGIALALKTRGIAFAESRRIRSIRTSNVAENRSMIAVNRRLGYRPLAEWSFLRRPCTQSSSPMS